MLIITYWILNCLFLSFYYAKVKNHAWKYVCKKIIIKTRKIVFQGIYSERGEGVELPARQLILYYN